MPLVFDKIISWTVAALVALMPFLCTISDEVMGKEYPVFYALMLSIVLIVALLLHRLSGRRALKPSVADGLIAAYLVYCALNSGLLDGSGTDGLVVWKWSAVLSGYIVVRMLDYRQPVMTGLVASGVLQTTIAVLQKTGLMMSNHMLFGVTGSFGNPGHLGGFLAVCFVVALSIFANMGKTKRGAMYFLYIAILLVLIAGLWLADSRASLIGVVAGAVYVYRDRFAKWIRKPWIVATVSLTGLVALALVFNYRQGSASARLLVWRVSLEMIADKPVFGHGTGSFNKHYLNYQGDYFEAHPDSRFVMIADNAAYTYNEAIHLVVEQGVVGLLVVLSLLVVLFRKPLSPGRGGVSRAGLVAWIGFAMFSYPVSVFPLLMIAGLITGGIDTKVALSFRLPKWTGIVLVLAGAGVIYGAFSKLEFYRKCNDREFVEANFDKVKYNQLLNDIYISYLLDGERYDEIIGRREYFFPSSGIYCDLGDSYMRKSMYDDAEQCYIKASNIVPTRFMPTYLLWKMYIARGDTAKALRVAEELLVKPLKVENTLTLRKKAELREFLESYND